MGNTSFRPEDLELADKVKSIDQMIYGLSIIDKMGQLLAFSPESHYTSKTDSEKQNWAITAQRMALLFSMATEHDKTLTPLEAIVLIRKEVKEVAVPIPGLDIIVVALVPQSINGAVVSSKIRDFFLKKL
ncbi:MAG: hypothetical protein ACYC7D_00080 [Nitrososphaerales archaeon]